MLGEKRQKQAGGSAELVMERLMQPLEHVVKAYTSYPCGAGACVRECQPPMNVREEAGTKGLRP